MELFYTVTSQEGVAQSKPTSSLGGFCSTSKVPNGTLENLFSEISPYTLQHPKAEYIGLILKNTWGDISNLSLWMEVPDNSLCKYRIAVVQLTDSGEMEVISGVGSRPLYAEFETTSQYDKLVLDFGEAFSKNQMLGLWIERTINLESDEYKKRNDCDTLYRMYQEKVFWDTEEEVELKIEFS